MQGAARRGEQTVAVAAPFGRDLGACFARIERTLERARRRSAGLVVLPECALGGCMREPLPGELGPDLPREHLPAVRPVVAISRFARA